MTVDDKLDLLLKEVGTVKTDVQGLKTDVQGLKTDVQGLKTDVQDLKTDVRQLKFDMVDVKGRLTRLETTLETETNRNILIIADGHLALLRKLDEAQDLNVETEMYRIRFNVLENDVQKLKQAAI